MKISDEASALNEAILSRVERVGGSYVWDAGVFVVTLTSTPASDRDVADLPGLCGVQQIALDASNLSFPAVLAIAQTPGLESLVLVHASFARQQLQELKRTVNQLVLADEG